MWGRRGLGALVLVAWSTAAVALPWPTCEWQAALQEPWPPARLAAQAALPTSA